MENKRVCDFITISTTGEQPDASIFCVGFSDSDGLETQVKLHGGARELAHMASSMVGRLCETLIKEDSHEACAAFTELVLKNIANAIGEGLKNE